MIFDSIYVFRHVFDRYKTFSVNDLQILSEIFFVSSGADIRPLSQSNLGDFFPNFRKKFPIVDLKNVRTS